MSSEQLAEIRHTELFWVCVPYVGLILIAFIIWVIFFRSKLNEKDGRVAMTVIEALKSYFLILDIIVVLSLSSSM